MNLRNCWTRLDGDEAQLLVWIGSEFPRIGEQRSVYIRRQQVEVVVDSIEEVRQPALTNHDLMVVCHREVPA